MGGRKKRGPQENRKGGEKRVNTASRGGGKRRGKKSRKVGWSQFEPGEEAIHKSA